jgi:hypothetical protein
VSEGNGSIDRDGGALGDVLKVLYAVVVVLLMVALAALVLAGLAWALGVIVHAVVYFFDRGWDAVR